jgi:2-methylcitrate dehydratase PrpD
MDTEHALARHLSSASFDALPSAAIAAAKRSLVDTLAVAWGATNSPGMAEIQRAVLRDAAPGPGTVWTAGMSVPVRPAVFINSVAAAALDYDSVYPDAAVHTDIVVVPVALAMGESLSLPGRDVLCAIAVGSDLMCRLARATRANSGWFYTSVYGAIAAAAVTAKLRNAGEEAVGHAMGLGFMNAAGTYQPVIERSPSKRLLAAFAAESGLLSGQLAAEGYSGPREWLSGKFGVHALYESGDAACITRGLGEVYENTRLSVKPYPSCQCNHAAIDALLALRTRHRLRPEDVAEIEVVISPYMDRLVGGPYSPGEAPQVAAQFSVRYSLARTLLDGRLGIAEVQKEAALDPAAAEWAARVRVTVDPENQANYCPVTVRVTTRDGSVLSQTAAVVRGSAEAPLTSNEWKDKFSDCAGAAGNRITDQQAGAMIEAIMEIDREPTITGFVSRVARMRDSSAQA